MSRAASLALAACFALACSTPAPRAELAARAHEPVSSLHRSRLPGDAHDSRRAARTCLIEGAPARAADDTSLASPAREVPTDPDAVPWIPLGRGIAVKDLGPAAGVHTFVGYGAFRVRAPWARTWVSALWSASLRGLGVRYLVAVRGPSNAFYRTREVDRRREIENARLAAWLTENTTGDAKVLVAAHSSGTYVAHELFQLLLAHRRRASATMRDRVLYWNLDGGVEGLEPAIVGALRHLWFVWSRNPRNDTRSPNATAMFAGAERFASSELMELDASDSDCEANARWCVHMTAVVRRPHKHHTGWSMADYSRFDETHSVSTAWVERASQWMTPRRAPRDP